MEHGIANRIADFVALLVSAWIEMQQTKNTEVAIYVALLVSAWIEMLEMGDIDVLDRCRTPRECVD